MDYASESDDECGLEEQYYSAKEAASIDEAIHALESVVEMDVDKTKWGFKALKQVAKLLLRKDSQRALDCHCRLLAYHGSKHITPNDVDKALESLWNQYCEIATDPDTRRGYCLTTLSLLQSFPGRLTRLKWLARLAQQCSSEEHHRQLADQVDDLQQVMEGAYAVDEIISDCVKDYLVDALSLTTSLFLLKKRYAHAESNLVHLKQLAEAEISKPTECQAFIIEMRARISFARGKSRRMASDNWLDTFACLSRWDVDGFHLVGMRLSDLVNTNSRAIPLKYIAKVSLKTVTEEHAFGVRLTVQAERGSAPFWKEHSQHQTSDSFTTLLQNGVALRSVRNLLANAFVVTLNLTDTFPFASFWIGAPTGTLHIQKLNHLFHDFCHPRLFPLQAFGDVRVDHLETLLYFTRLKEETHDFLGPLGNAQVKRLDVILICRVGG
ncbi:hypothetical protein AAVH_19913 [Aphelenchoides avenae]|nr:hypothetical protein AAVH_19913 [Aphelenchus avenae]